MAPIPPGATIGIIGGGQLGRMLAEAASALGYRTHIYTPERDAPASQTAGLTTIGDYADHAAIRHFAKAVDIVTFEFENVPAASLAILEKEVTVAPSARILAISQNRIREKDFLRSLGIATTDYARVMNLQDLEEAVARLGRPSILKTAELGYDGKGQFKILNDTNLTVGWASFRCPEAILEAYADFESEISVIVARNAKGEIAAYDTAHNIHLHHILDTTTVPAPIGERQHAQAMDIARKIAEAMELVGLLAVEMFVMKQGDLWVNELAPRPHNSGHWTMDACHTSQFEQHIRAICGWPLGNIARTHSVRMKNLIGEDVNQWLDYAGRRDAKLHLYGKKTVRPGRKMGHVNFLSPA